MSNGTVDDQRGATPPQCAASDETPIDCPVCKANDRAFPGPTVPMGCACKGGKARAHPACIAKFAWDQEEGRTFENPFWGQCAACQQEYSPKLRAEMAPIRWEHCKDLPPEDRKYKYALLMRAKSHHDMLEFEEAIRLFKEVADVAKRCIKEGQDDPKKVNMDIAMISLLEMGECHLRLMDPQAALRVDEEAVEVAEEMDGPGSVAALRAKEKLLRCYTFDGVNWERGPPGETFNNLFNNWGVGDADLSKALELGKEVVEGLREKEGPASESALAAVKDMAVMHLRRGDGDEALPLFEDCYRTSLKHFGPNHHRTMGFEMLYNNMLRMIGISKSHPTGTLRGLQKRPDLNGERVSVLRVPKTGRFHCEMAQGKKMLAVSPANIILDPGTRVMIYASIDAEMTCNCMVRGKVEHFSDEEGLYSVKEEEGKERTLRVKPEDCAPFA